MCDIPLFAHLNDFICVCLGKTILVHLIQVGSYLSKHRYLYESG
jgi:hypothetical protein